MFRSCNNSFPTASRIFRIQSMWTDYFSLNAAFTMPFYCSHTFHGSRVLTPLLGLQGSLGSAQVSLSPTLTCISCSVTQYCPSTRGVSASQHLFKTIPFTWMPVPLLSKFYPSFLIHFPHETFSNFPDFRIPVAFSVWTMHLDTLLYIILFSNCFVYI